ncbi:hypothetical protein EJ04DRAFT_224105 [Polyplosphaeria fusca]|uniref:Uncharacterized protein n=1 Tax=Polyplosphaeria fusca TaxID=682080 RepID=A0A9P4V060_9PLEO|nr:hypothetical protein EJ04DRAFT_224105 [Polyplosphaeria fusca]
MALGGRAGNRRSWASMNLTEIGLSHMCCLGVTTLSSCLQISYSLPISYPDSSITFMSRSERASERRRHESFSYQSPSNPAHSVISSAAAPKALRTHRTAPGNAGHIMYGVQGLPPPSLACAQLNCRGPYVPKKSAPPPIHP